MKNDNKPIIVILVIVGILILLNLQKAPVPPPESATPTDTKIYISTPPPAPTPTPEPYTDKTLPSSLMASASPSVIKMNGYVDGIITSNGRNFMITTQANFLTGSQITDVAGFCGNDGMWKFRQQINSPGFWQFQTTSENGIKSNTAYLEVRGMMIRGDKERLSRFSPLGSDVVFTVYSNHRLSTVNINMYPGGDLTRPVFLGTGRTNKEGFYQATIKVPTGTLGNYMIDVSYGTDAAHLYTYGETWISIQR